MRGKLTTDCVTGTIITTIGITLFPVAINWAGGGHGSPNFGDPRNLLVVAAVLLTILVINKYVRGFFANISVLLGMIVGFVIALAFGFVNFSGVGQAGWFALVYPFAFGMPTFDLAAIASLCLVMVVIMVESLGMFLALGDLAGRPVRHDDASRGLRTDGLGTVIGGLFNTFPHSSFSQNIGLVGITGVRSRWVVVVSGVILMSLGLLPKLSNVIASIPVVVRAMSRAAAGVCPYHDCVSENCCGVHPDARYQGGSRYASRAASESRQLFKND